MNVELLRQFGQRLLALDGGQSHLGLESRAVIPARSSRHRLSCPRAILAAVRQKLHLSTCPNLSGQLSSTRSTGRKSATGSGSSAPRAAVRSVAGRMVLWCSISAMAAGGTRVTRPGVTVGAAESPRLP